MANRHSWVRYARVVGGVAGVVVVALLIRALGPAHVAGYLRRVGWGFSWILATYLLSNVIYALPLGVVLPRGARPSLVALVASRFAAVAVNAATPFLGVGGEPVRLLWLPPALRRASVAGLVIDRGAFLVASSLFLLAGAAVAAVRLPLPDAARIGLLAVSALGLGLALLLYVLQRRGKLAAPLARVAGAIVPRHREQLAARARELDDNVRALHAGRAHHVTLAVVLHLLGRAAAGLEVYAALRLLGLDPGFAAAFILTAVPLAVDLVFSMVPSQIGVHEGASALLAQALGLDPAAGVAIVFLQRLRQVVFVSAGFLLLALRRAPVAAVSASTSAA